MIKYCCDWCGAEIDLPNVNDHIIQFPHLMVKTLFGIEVEEPYVMGDHGEYLVCDECVRKMWRLRDKKYWKVKT